MEEDGPPSPIISSPGVSRSPSHSRSGRGTRDTHLERKEYTETHKRPRLRSQDPDDRHTLFLDEQRPQTNGNSGQVDIYGDVKGKGRAIDIDHIEPRPLDSVNDRVSDVDGVRTSTPPRSTARDDMMPSTSAVAATGGTEVHAAVQREKPKIRPGWQAMHAHLLDPSRRREVKRTATEHEAEPFVTPAGNASPSVTGFSIRGAAARTIVTESSTPSTSFIEPPPKHVAGDTTQPFEPPQSMSSRDIMARTRAKLEKLKQDSSFPVATTPESGEHDVASLNASSSVINTLPTIVDGNHTVTLPSHAASTSIPSQLSDVLPAQSSHPHSLAHASHETGAADALRLKVLNKLENEKRAHIDGKRIPHHDGDSPMFVAVNGSSVEALASPDNFGDPKQQQTGEEMSLARRQDAEMLEQRLRVQAQLRIKGAAHKQPMPGTASDNTSGQSADLNSQSREEYLRSRLKRMASR
ncbi:hypothetical protein BDW22DRAFT_676081 [Trametopsis cervina]|nr:hypothetical protein BDW22DRAFT_676081 [Trametopsis cervina]